MIAKERKAKVYHADLWGLREDKYTWLSEHDWETSDWQAVHPRTEFYLFVPRDEAVLERYQKFIKVTDIFPVSSTGIKTHRDHFVIDFDKRVLKRRIRTFLDPSLPDELVRATFKLKNTHSWNLTDKRKLIQQDKHWNKKILPCLYRPFDVRWLFYHQLAVDRGRGEVMRHMMHDNLGLISMRQVALDEPYTHVLATSNLVDNRAFTSSRGTTRFLPLYLYINDKTELFARYKPGRECKSNISPGLFLELAASYSVELTSEAIFGYIYAVLHSNIYRETYSESLRIDFPRIPFTKDHELFGNLAALGEQLVDLHLLRSSDLDPPIARFQAKGDNKVRSGKKGLRYDPNDQRVYINEEQFFEGVPSELWEYQIGGYQVCHKWLKDRRDRCLSLEEIKTYCRIVTALEKTIQIQAEIDTLYPQVEKTLLPIHLESE